MQVNFKLFASLMSYLPEGAHKNVISLEVEDNITPNQLIDKYSVPKSEVHLVLVNGVYQYESDRDNPLKNNDTLAIWPPVAGG
jgi:molybdopterin synthase sulfur carrier subunit